MRGQTNMGSKAKYGVWKSKVKTGKYLSGVVGGQFHVLFGPELIRVIFQKW